MENIFYLLFQQSGSIDIDDYGNLQYNQASFSNSDKIYTLVQQQSYSTYPTLTIPNLDTSNTENQAEVGLDYIIEDSIMNSIPGTYIPESIDSIPPIKLRDLIKFNRRFTHKDSIYQNRSFTEVKVYKFMIESYDIFMTIPSDLLLNELKFDADLTHTKKNEILHSNSRLVSFKIGCVCIFVHIDYADPFKLIFSQIEQSNLLKFKELLFTMEILEVRLASINEDIILLHVRCSYLYHIIRVKFKNRHGMASSKKVSVRLQSTFTFDSQIMYSCTNSLNEHVICTENDLFLYDSNFVMVDSIKFDGKSKFKHRFSRGIFSDHPRSLLQLSNQNILSFDFRISNRGGLVNMCFDSLVNWLGKNEEHLSPVLGSSPTSPYIYYTGSTKNINFLDIRNPHSFCFVFEHKLHNPSYNISIPNDPALMLFYSYKNNMNTVGLILEQDSALIPSYISVNNVSDEPLINILGVDAVFEDDNLSTYILGSNGTLYNQMYSKTRSETPIEFHANSVVRPRECQLEPSPKIKSSYSGSNKLLFKMIGNCVKGNNIPNAVPKCTRTHINHKKNWEYFVNSQLDTYPKVSDYYNQWFRDSVKDSCDLVTDLIPVDIVKRTFVVDSNSDEGF